MHAARVQINGLISEYRDTHNLKWMHHAAYEKGWGWIREAGVYHEGPVVVQASAARFGSVQKYRDL
jgi:hypothetical protein